MIVLPSILAAVIVIQCQLCRFLTLPLVKFRKPSGHGSVLRGRRFATSADSLHPSWRSRYKSTDRCREMRYRAEILKR